MMALRGSVRAAVEDMRQARLRQLDWGARRRDSALSATIGFTRAARRARPHELAALMTHDGR
jgi:hypothetical protein